MNSEPQSPTLIIPYHAKCTEAELYRTLVCELATRCKMLELRTRRLEAEIAAKNAEMRRESWEGRADQNSKRRSLLGQFSSNGSAPNLADMSAQVKSRLASRDGLWLVFDDIALLEKAWMWY